MARHTLILIEENQCMNEKKSLLLTYVEDTQIGVTEKPGNETAAVCLDLI